MRRAIGIAAASVLALAACSSELDEYRRKGKMSEYKLGLNRLAKGVKRYYFEQGKLPPMNGGPTPPPGSCCAGPQHKCAVDADLWLQPPWSDLEFGEPHPHYYSYQYELVAPDRAVLRAHGDLDCDTDISVYEVKVTVVDGTPQASEPIEKAPE